MIENNNNDVVSPTTPRYLYGIGFAITFSSLYAKIARVLRIFNVGSRTSTLKRAPVKIQDMVAYQAVSILFEFGVCFVWHMMNPLVWNRQVMCVQYEEREDGGKKMACDGRECVYECKVPVTDEYGNPLESQGFCGPKYDGPNGHWPFLLVILGAHTIVLLYTVVLCYKTSWA